MPSSQLQRRRRKAAETAEREILDDEQQEQYIQRVERDLAVQTRQTRIVVAGTDCLIAALYFFLILLQIFRPWGLAHQAAFQGIVPSLSIVLADIGSSFCALLAAASILVCGSRRGQDWRKPLSLSVTLSLFVFGFWGTALFKLVGAPGGGVVLGRLWRVSWRPIVPVAVPVATAVAIDGLTRLQMGVDELKASQYSMKHA